MASDLQERATRRARLRLAVTVVVGLAVGGAALSVWSPAAAFVAGWGAASLVFTAWTWIGLGRLDPAKTALHATREDPTRQVTDVLLLFASVASLVAVVSVLVTARAGSGLERDLLALVAVASVTFSWLVVHTLYALRYAAMYYAEPVGGIDFGGEGQPRYADFAYVAFTVGMTFQIADTDLRSSTFRATVLRHALLSYLFGTVVIATSVNLIASFAA